MSKKNAKKLSIIITGLILFAMVGFFGSLNIPQTEATASLCGDVNCDGVINVDDSTLVYNYYVYGAEQYPICNEWAADINCDGKITLSDNRKIFNYVNDPSQYILECCAIINHLPIGSLDKADQTSITGWAYDKNAGSNPIDVHIYIDGKYVGLATANQSRPDLVSAKVALDPNHGFTFSTPTNLSVGEHTVQAYAINYSEGVNPELIGSPKTITIGGEPICGNNICETGEDGFICPEDCCVNGDGVCREGCTSANDDDCQSVKILQLTNTPKIDDNHVYHNIYPWNPSGDTIVWSSFGEKIYESSIIVNGAELEFQKGDIWIMNSDGSNKRIIVKDLREYSPKTSWVPFRPYPIWSNDGKKVYFTSDLVDDDELIMNFHVVDIDTLEIEQISFYEDAGTWIQTVMLSPNGKQLGYCISKDGNPNVDIHFINTDGTNLRKFTKEGDHCLDHPEWSPDGKKIYYLYMHCTAFEWQHGGCGDYRELRLMNPDFTDDRILVPQGSGWCHHGMWSWDSKYRYYNLDHYLMRVDLNGNQEIITDFDDYFPYHVAISPDGTKAALDTGPRLVNSDTIEIVDIETGAREKIADITGNTYSARPSWNPDGTKILYNFCNEGGNRDLYVIQLNAPKCGNNVCETGETPQNCPEDCGEFSINKAEIVNTLEYHRKKGFKDEGEAADYVMAKTWLDSPIENKQEVIDYLDSLQQEDGAWGFMSDKRQKMVTFVLSVYRAMDAMPKKSLDPFFDSHPEYTDWEAAKDYHPCYSGDVRSCMYHLIQGYRMYYNKLPSWMDEFFSFCEKDLTWTTDEGLHKRTHILYPYLYTGHPYPNHDGIIDATIRLQEPDGSWIDYTRNPPMQNTEIQLLLIQGLKILYPDRANELQIAIDKSKPYVMSTYKTITEGGKTFGYFEEDGSIISMWGGALRGVCSGLIEGNVDPFFGGPGSVCGNGVCETGETPQNCPEDCSSVINHLPIGYLDGATETSIFGWAYDKNAGSNPIDVHIYIDGKCVGLATANQSRSDLVTAGATPDPNHGFTFPTPTNLSVGEHTAQAYAINYPEGVNPELIGSPKTITIGGESVCGNNICELGENSNNCPEDCFIIDNKEFILNYLNYQIPNLLDSKLSPLHSNFLVLSYPFLDENLPRKNEIIEFFNSSQNDEGTWDKENEHYVPLTATVLMFYEGEGIKPPKSLDPFFETIDTYDEVIEHIQTYSPGHYESNYWGELWGYVAVYFVHKKEIPPWMDDYISDVESNFDDWAYKNHQRNHVVVPYYYMCKTPLKQEELVNIIIEQQNADGGWGWDEKSPSDVSETVTTLWFLKNQQSSDSKIETAIDRAENYILQNYKTKIYEEKKYGAFSLTIDSNMDTIGTALALFAITEKYDILMGWEVCVDKCGNGICETGETPQNCPEDCSSVINHLPIGYLDGTTETSIFGWAYDKNAGSNPIDVHIYIDGKYVGLATANQSRPDLVSAKVALDPNHGFTFPTPTNLSVGEHTAQAYAINYPKGVNPELIGSPKIIIIGGEPICGNGVCETGETGYTCQEDCCVDGDGVCRKGCTIENDDDCQSVTILQLTNTPEFDDKHVYFNICPWNPSGDRIVWSSFGEKIYESSIIVNGAELEFKKGDIWTMNSDGSDKRIIVKDIREYSPKTSWVPFRPYPIWSADGKKVYFTSDLVQDDELIMNFHAVDIDTLEIKQITSYEDPGTWIQTVELSPDGKQLGYCTTKDGDLNVDIHFINIDGTSLIKFTKEGDHCVDHPKWSPDGKKIQYNYYHCKSSEWPCQEKTELRVMNADFTDDRILTPQGSGWNHHGSWGQDSKYFYYNLDNYLMRIDLNGNKKIITDFGNAFPWHVAISPDGNKAVLDTGPRLCSADTIEIVDIDTGVREKIADITGNTYSARPSWNPDGTKILYDFCNEAGNRDLYFVQLTTPKCGNGVCEIGDGETGFTCPEDCCVDGDGICREGCTFANDDDCEEVAMDKAEIVNTLEYQRKKGFKDELEAAYYVIAKTWLDSPIENKQEIIDYLDSLQQEDGAWGYLDYKRQKMVAFILPVYLAMDAMPKKSLDPFFDSHPEYTEWEAALDYPCLSGDVRSCIYHLAQGYRSYYGKLPPWIDEFFPFCEEDLTWTTDGGLHFRSHVLYPYLYAGHPYPNHDGIIDATIQLQEPNGSWIDYTRDGFQDTHIQLLLIQGLKILYPDRADELQIAVDKSKPYVMSTYKTITEGDKTFGYFVGYPGENGRVSSIWQGVLASICSGLIEGNVDPFFGGPGSVCGNGICETGETPQNCPEDCSSVINHLPIGYLDGATETSIFGWAYDKNAGSNPIDVHIYIDGNLAGSAIANLNRPDLVSADVTLDPNHGFTFPTPTNLSVGEHTAQAYAINYPKGVNPELIGSPKIIIIGGELPISNNILIKTENNPEVYQIVNNKKHWISNPAVFTSYDFSIEDVIIISEAELNLYPQIKLIRNENNNKIYYLNQTPKGILKRHLINPDVFLSYGNKWEDVITVNDIETQSYGNINLIKTKNNPDIYLIQENSKMLISSPEVFSAKGYDWEKIVEVNDIEMNSYEVKSL